MEVLNNIFLFIIDLLVFFYIENTTASRTENTDPLPNPWAPRGTGTAAHCCT